MNKEKVAQLAEALRGAEFPPRFQPHESRLLIQVSRLVAEGRPVTSAQIQQIASSVEMPFDAAISFLSKVSEHDDEGNVVGIFGLSQKSHPHRFEVNGHVLSAWCAWDTLFLPAILKQDAEVESSCPATKQKIRLRLTPARVEEVAPSSSVLSLVVPQVKKANVNAVEEIWAVFCCLVHFFSSEESASVWMSGRGEDIRILSVEEGYDLGRVAFEEVLQYA